MQSGVARVRRIPGQQGDGSLMCPPSAVVCCAPILVQPRTIAPPTWAMRPSPFTLEARIRPANRRSDVSYLRRRWCCPALLTGGDFVSNKRGLSTCAPDLSSGDKRSIQSCRCGGPDVQQTQSIRGKRNQFREQDDIVEAAREMAPHIAAFRDQIEC